MTNAFDTYQIITDCIGRTIVTNTELIEVPQLPMQFLMLEVLKIFFKPGYFFYNLSAMTESSLSRFARAVVLHLTETIFFHHFSMRNIFLFSLHPLAQFQQETSFELKPFIRITRRNSSNFCSTMAPICLLSCAVVMRNIIP